MSKKFLPIILTLCFLSFTLPPVSQARTTPEDILNQQRDAYNQRVKSYSPANKQKLEDFSKKVAEVNKKATDELSLNMEKQGQILEEFIRRNNLSEASNDGIHRNLSQPIENARYWLTFAHEAVAYQAAKNYIFNLTGESNVKRDILITVSQLEGDLNILKGKVLKSQQIIKTLIR